MTLRSKPEQAVSGLLSASLNRSLRALVAAQATVTFDHGLWGGHGQQRRRRAGGGGGGSWEGKVQWAQCFSVTSEACGLVESGCGPGRQPVLGRSDSPMQSDTRFVVPAMS